jgi:signal transduction histidine kinase
LASPAVRKRAWDLGIELRFVAGSGPAGRVMHEDLDAYLQSQGSGQAARGGSAYVERHDQDVVPVIGSPGQPADAGGASFLSKITHDLRQPMHALSLMTGALERRTQDPESRDIVEDLSKVVRSIQAAFENIVEWTRLESGPVGVVPVDVQAGDILKSLADEFETEAARRRIAFRSVPAKAMVACDPALVQRILRQFLDNAMKFTPSGKVLLGARRHGPMLRLIVADTGVGIPADQSDIIFRPYTRLDPGREAGGLGLGLAIARRLADLAGLEIGVRSEPGKGSQFWIDVPLSGG